MVLLLIMWAVIGLVVAVGSYVVNWYIKRSNNERWLPLISAIEKENARKRNQGWWPSIRDTGLYMLIWPILLIFMYQALTARGEKMERLGETIKDIEQERDEEDRENKDK